MASGPWFWVGFASVVSVLLAMDLGVFHRDSHMVSTREALTWTCVWALCASLFGVWVWKAMGPTKGLEFFTGYVIELSLSVDNLFVIVLIFSSFAVPSLYQHRVLFWGILGAVAMRGAMIGLGAALVERFHWVLYFFGAFLVYLGVKMLFGQDQDPNPQNNKALALFRRLVPSVNHYHGQNFFVREHGKLLATPLLAALVVVEAMDVVFAVDSIPAIFAITTDSFIVFTSNIFAILGLRSMYFLLANVVEKFTHLKVGLACVLAFVGCKMLLQGFVHVPLWLSLCVILGLLVGSVLYSIFAARRHT